MTCRRRYPGSRERRLPGFLAVLHWSPCTLGCSCGSCSLPLLAVIVWLVDGIALEVAEVRAREASALSCAPTYLPLLWYAARVAPEILASALVTLAIFLLDQSQEETVAAAVDRGRAHACGGACAYAEIAGLGVVMGLGLLLTGKGSYWSRSRLLPPAIVLAAMTLALAPWTIRNANVAHSFVPFDTYLGVDLIASADQ